MFRIKTDIRQYKCENKAKVEKLIHNWVVRPSDLIFQDDAWHPIGKHPEFENIFNVLASEDKGEGDTVVTESPFEAQEQKKKEEEVEKKSDDVFDQKDILADLSTPDLNLAPPVAPEGVEPAHHDDEVTMMTDRTLDMLMDYDPSLKTEIENQKSEEKTQIKENPLEDLDRTIDLPTDSSSDETTDIKESPLDSDETTDIKESPLHASDETTNIKESPLTSTEDEETTNVIESPFKEEISDVSEARDIDEEPKVVVDEEAQTTEKDREDAEPSIGEEGSAPKLGRHDLPEDFFATNEISKVNREDVEKRDDLNKNEDDNVDDVWDEIESEFSETESISEDSDSFDEAEEDPNAESVVEEEEPEVLHINGYEIDFPFKIGPTAEDRKLGLKTSKYDLQRRENTYPHPYEKKYKDPHIRSFSWKREPPKDLSFLVVAGAVIVLILIVLLLSQC